VRAEEHGVVAVHRARPHVDLHVRPADNYTSVMSAPRTTHRFARQTHGDTTYDTN
jgi:hypothetical protein